MARNGRTVHAVPDPLAVIVGSYFDGYFGSYFKQVTVVGDDGTNH